MRRRGQVLAAVIAAAAAAGDADPITMTPPATYLPKFVASVISRIIPLPGVKSTAKGMLLLCDLVDGGDLEEAMSTKQAARKGKRRIRAVHEHHSIACRKQPLC